MLGESSLRHVPRLVTAALVTAALVTFPSGNATAQSARWVLSVEVDGAACQTQRAAFEREVLLACEAMGTCKLSPSGLHAVVKATLVCLSNDAWWIQTEAADGTPIAALELRKAPDVDRLREAAVEVARAAPPETKPALAFPPSTREPGPIDGGFLTIGAAAVAGGSGRDEMRHARGGVGFGLGAPFDEGSILGAAAELGVDGMQAYGLPDFRGFRLAELRVAGYAQVSLVARYPKWVAVRPFVAASAIAFTDLPWVSGSLDLGAAFPLL
jgi:hypothetical protein